jgi:hypothetical protein
MKSFLISISFLFAVAFANAQNSNTAFCDSKSKLIKGIETGLIEIKLPEAVTNSEVEKYAEYYKNAFVVSFNEKTHIVNIKMIENNSSNRRVILRFLGANQVHNITVEGSSFLMNDFYETFLK